MEATGNFSTWEDCFPNSLLPQLFEILVTEWPEFRRPSSNPLKNRITHNFVDHLKRKTRNKVPFSFFYRDKQTSFEKDSEEGEIDIAVRASFVSEVFFALECKRLNITDSKGSLRSDAGKYVGAEGMGCFISGQYRGGGSSAGMIGYVMDGKVQAAQNSIDRVLAKSADNLAFLEEGKMTESKDFDSTLGVLQTTHTEPVSPFSIYHLIFPFTESHLE